MQRLRKLTHGRLARVFTVLLFLLGIVAIVYSIWGHEYVRDAYQASVDGHPTHSFIDHNRHDLDHYLNRADQIFWEYLILGIPLTLLFWFLLAFLIKRMLAVNADEIPRTGVSLRMRGDTWIALGCYALLTVIYFYPCIPNFGTAIIGPPGDNMAGLWSLWWGYDMCLLSDHSITFSNHLYYPEGSSLYYFAWSFYNLGFSCLARLFVNCTAAFNLVMLHGYPIAGLGAFLLVRRLTGNSLVAMIGGFVFAFSPTHFIRSQHHIHMNSIQFIPFFVMYFIDCIRDRTKLSLALAALFFLLNTLSDWTYMIMSGYFIFFGYLYLALKSRRWWLPDYLLRAGVVVGATMILLSPWLIGMIRIGLTNPEVDVGGRNTYVTDAFALIVPGLEHWSSRWQFVSDINDTYTGNATETANYLGLAAIAIVLLTIRRTLRSATKWWLGFVAFLLLSLGPQLHVLGKSLAIGLPYTLIAYVPFLANVRAPSRFIVFVYLFWSVILGMGLHDIFKRFAAGWRRYLVLVLLPALLLADYFSICTAQTPVTVAECLSDLGRNDPGSGILNLPLSYDLSTRYMMEQTLHGLPIVQGAATRKVGKSLEDRLAYTDLALQKKQLTDARVKYIVIHRGTDLDSSLVISDYLAKYELFTQDSHCLVLRVYH